MAEAGRGWQRLAEACLRAHLRHHGKDVVLVGGVGVEARVHAKGDKADHEAKEELVDGRRQTMEGDRRKLESGMALRWHRDDMKAAGRRQELAPGRWSPT